MVNCVVRSLLRSRSAPAILLLRSSSPPYITPPPAATICKTISSLAACSSRVAGRKLEEAVPMWSLIRRVSFSTLPERLVVTEVVKSKSGGDFIQLNDEEIRRVNAKWKELVNKNKQLEDKNKSIEEQALRVAILVTAFCYVTVILSLTFGISVSIILEIFK